MTDMFIVQCILIYICIYNYIQRWHVWHVHYWWGSYAYIYIYIQVAWLPCSLFSVFLHVYIYIYIYIFRWHGRHVHYSSCSNTLYTYVYTYRCHGCHIHYTWYSYICIYIYICEYMYISDMTAMGIIHNIVIYICIYKQVAWLPCSLFMAF